MNETGSLDYSKLRPDTDRYIVCGMHYIYALFFLHIVAMLAVSRHVGVYSGDQSLFGPALSGSAIWSVNVTQVVQRFISSRPTVYNATAHTLCGALSGRGLNSAAHYTRRPNDQLSYSHRV